jgi:hypothetical protein
MNSTSIERIDKTKILPLSKWHFFLHYFVAFIPLILGLMNTYWLVERWNTENYVGSRTEEGIISSILVWFSIAILAFIVKRRRLNFERIDISLSGIEFKQKMLEISELENWRLTNKNGKSAIFFNNNSGRNWGLKMTAIRFKDYLLVNSVCDFENTPSFSIFGNERNIKRLRKHLKKASG